MLVLSRFAGFVVLMIASQSLQAGLNKWVDENGQVHYGDRVPAKYLKKERSILNDQGIVVKKYKARLTRADILKKQKERQEEAERKRQQAIADAEVALRDRVLLETFTTERDIIIARDARVDAVQSQISLTETNIKNYEEKLRKGKKRILAIEESNRNVPENMRKNVVAVSRQLETYYQYVEAKAIEKQKIIDRFDKDIKRFRELRRTVTR